jgi:signal transduction histidine kinase
LFGVVFAIGIVLLLGLVYFQTAGYLSARVDRALAIELKVLRRGGPEAILQRLQQEAARDPLNNFGLFSQTGERIAGDAQHIPATLPLDGTASDLPAHAGMGPRRAIAQRLPWGEVLVVERDTSQLVELRWIILSALLWSGAVIAILGLVSALALSLRPLRRIRTMQAVTDRIISGDFAVRLPVEGRRDELDQLARLVNGMMNEVERLVVQAQTVGESVAHELRTPLTRLRAVLDHACQGRDDGDPGKPLLEQCVSDIDVILTRFRALLRIAAVEARSRQSGVEIVSLRTIIEQIAELHQPVAVERDISLEIVSGDDRFEIRADGELLFEAISNLVDNALKFTPQAGKVRIRISGGPGAPVIEITDNGPGIPEAERALVTQRFYRSQRDRHVQGHGLGLSLVAAVADLHGFTLSIQDASPGTTVRIVCNGRLAI